MKYNGALLMNEDELDAVVGGMGVETLRMQKAAEMPNRYWNSAVGYICEEISGSTLGNTLRVRITDISEVIDRNPSIVVGAEVTVPKSQLVPVEADTVL